MAHLGARATNPALVGVRNINFDDHTIYVDPDVIPLLKNAETYPGCLPTTGTLDKAEVLKPSSLRNERLLCEPGSDACSE